MAPATVKNGPPLAARRRSRPGRHRRDIITLPGQLRRTLTWDQGKEMAYHARLDHRHRHPGLLLRPPRALAARHQREHQRPAAPVPAQRHRPVGPLRRRPRRHRGQPQQPAPQDARIHETIREARRASCAHRLNPPRQGSSEARHRAVPCLVKTFFTIYQGHALRARQAGAEPGQISCTDAEVTRRNRELERWDAA